MDPRKDPQQQQDEDVREEGPELEQTDWDALEGGTLTPDSIPENGDFRYDVETHESLEEEDDDPYQNSDEALPDDQEEAAIDRSSDREAGRFNEV